MTKIEIETSEDIFEAITQEKYPYTIHDKTEKEYCFELQKKWASVDSLLTLTTSELINEIRKLHIQKCKELEDKNGN